MNALQQQQKALQEKMTAELQAAMNATPFPQGLLPTWFCDILGKALRHESQRTLECTWPMLNILLSFNKGELNLTEMGFALNAIESKSMVQLGIEVIEYQVVQQKVFELCTKWNELVVLVRNPISEKYSNVKPLFVPSKKKIFHH